MIQSRKFFTKDNFSHNFFAQKGVKPHKGTQKTPSDKTQKGQRQWAYFLRFAMRCG